MADNLFTIAGQDMAVDLGTANTLVYVRNRGVVLNEPSVVAINTHTNEALAVGMDAKRMIGRTPSYVQAIRPLRDGVIADFDITERMLRYFIQRVHRRRWAKPRIVICVPSGITGVERRAVEEAAYHAGARRAFTIDEPMAAAIGCALPVNEPIGSMVVDIGGGTTEVAVIALGGIVVSKSIRVGGDEMDERIIEWVKKEHNLLLGLRTAEQIKMTIGSAYPFHDEPSAEVRGRDLVSGLPKTILISASEVRTAIEGARIFDRRRGTGYLGQHPARVSRGPHGHRDRHHRRRSSTEGPHPSYLLRDRDDGEHRRATTPVRGDRVGEVPRGVRGAAYGARLVRSSLGGCRTITVVLGFLTQPGPLALPA